MIIKTPSRLHFGVINIGNEEYPLYKCLGCAIEEPKLLAYVEESKKLIIKGIDRKDLIQKFEKFSKRFERKILFDVKEEIPSHVGLGSTTQLSLAFAFSLCFFNKKKFNVYRVSKMLGIGKISGVGIGVFSKGGFIVDTGKRAKEIPKIEFRHDIPENWAFVILRDKRVSKGLHDKEEEKAFKILPKTPRERIEEMYRLVYVMEDSIKSSDIESFGFALTKLQTLVGMNFYKAQGGVFSSRIKDYVEFLLKNGAYGAGQSSWGPTVYGLYDKEKLRNIKDMFSNDIEIKITFGNNKGFSFSNSQD